LGNGSERNGSDREIEVVCSGLRRTGVGRWIGRRSDSLWAVEEMREGDGGGNGGRFGKGSRTLSTTGVSPSVWFNFFFIKKIK
jgi:hypothetical protein